MSKPVDDIFSDSHDQPDEGQMLNYLQQKLSSAEAHELENAMLNDPFVDDAMEGLAQLPQPESVPAIVTGLNKELHKNLRSAKAGRRREIHDMKPTLVTVFIILLLTVVAFVVYRMLVQHG